MSEIDCNTGLSIDQRVEALLSRMTLREKVGQLNQRMFGWNAVRKTPAGIELTDEFRQEVARWDGMGALYGLFRADPWSGRTVETGLDPAESAEAANLVQQYVRENTRLKIPVLLAEECPHGHQAVDGTLLPTGIGVAATWNPDCYEAAMGQVAREIRARGAHLGLVLNMDVSRDPRWGRTEECLGEDPYLASRFATAAVHGLQGRERSQLKSRDHVAATSKTFTAHGGPEGGRNLGAAAIGERELREIHLPPAKAAVAAGSQMLMGCYNEIDGIPCHANRKLMTDILRGEWGFEGAVMADGTAVDRLLMQTGSYPAAAAMALNAGVDLSLWDTAFTTLEEAVEQGLVSMTTLDQAVRRVLRVKFMLGLFEDWRADPVAAGEVVGSAPVRAASLALARDSMTLLKNDGALLPLPVTLKRVAVIGPNADSLYNQLGDYTSPQRAGAGITVLQGIRELLGASCDVVHAPGCGVRDPSEAGIAEAVALARTSEVAILVLGGSSTRNFDITFDANGAAVVGPNSREMDCGEGVDVADLELGGAQVKLAQAVIATGTPTVIVLIQGRPHSIPWLAENAKAILCAWYPGPEGGRAVAEALFGKINPGGRLPITVPRSSAELPVYYNRKDTGREILYHDTSGVLYPFGYGLSYTTFAYSDLTLSPGGLSVRQVQEGGTIRVEVTVRNTGERAGDEVVQLYIKDHEASITRRVKELKGFARVRLEPGESRRVGFELGREDLAIWNPGMALVVEPGNITIMVGGDSQTPTFWAKYRLKE